MFPHSDEAYYIYEEHMHQLEIEEAERDRIIEETLLELEAEKERMAECPICFGHGGCADCMNEDAEVPA